MKKLTQKIVGAVLAATMLAVTLFVGVNNSISNFKLSKAEDSPVVLNASNSPTLVSGSASRVDEKGVTWEYYNASDYAGGHVSLNNGGYFGIASSTAWGYTGINSITANFTSDNELWLLHSVDGNNWVEDKILTSGEETTSSNNWRYIRFYNWSDNNTAININSVSFNFTCSGVSATEDVDSAIIGNVIATNGLSYSRETTDVSPNSVGGEAVKFTKNGSGSTEVVIGFGKSYTIGEIAYSKVEFDMKTSNINYGKTVQLVGEKFSSSSINSSKHSAYHCASLGNAWYHIEVPITTFVSTISGYGNQDIPVKNIESKEVNAIKINAGTCVIDNLRISSTSTTLGLYNNGTSFSSGSVYWFKIAWTGVLHSCSMTFEPSNLARQVSLDDPNLKNGSPFYIEGLSAGTVVVTANLVVGYNRQVLTISNTLTIN